MVKHAFSRGALILADSKGQELKHPINADAVKLSSSNPLHPFDPEIEITLRSLSNFQEPKPMENNDQTLKELATPNVVYQPWKRPSQALQRISCSLFHNKAIRDTKRLHQDEGVSIFLGWSCKRLAVSATNSFQHLGRYEVH
ncbi:hypothetical protein CR513_58206, partial [Mucuna pruriens]